MASEEIVLTANETRQLYVQDGEYTITVPTNTQAVVIAELKEASTCSVHLHVAENASLTIFWWNTSAHLQMKETAELMQHAKLNVAYAELEAGQLNRQANYRLLGEEAAVHLISGAIVADEKHQDITCVHEAKHTESLMETYGLVLQQGKYHVLANGMIKKGASGSKSRQTSRVLTFADKQQAEVIPMLLIDENDVEASHATSIGQLDENQLYYLMSRGLSENEALRLLAMGYLLPLSNVTSDASLRQQLTETIEKKVQEICLI